MKSLLSRHAIYLKADALDGLLHPAGVRSNERQSRVLNIPPATLWRLRRGARVGERSIAEIMAAVAEVAVHLSVPALRFEDLFDVREADEQ